MLTKAEIIDGLFTLSVEECLEVRALLNEELDGVEPGEFSLSPEWRAEIGRRLDEYHRGEVKGIPAETVFAEIKEHLALRRGEETATQSDDLVAEAWTTEIDRRLDRLDRGETTASAWPEVNARLEQRLTEIERHGRPE